MTLTRGGRGLKAVAVSLALVSGMTACSRDYTVAYMYATSATRGIKGAVNAYAVDYQTGALNQLSDSPIPTQGSNPVSLVASPNGKSIYVIDHDTSQVEQFAVGSDGKLYDQNAYSVVSGANGVTGTFPVAAAIDATGNYLYVLFTFQNGFTPAKPGPGGVATFPITHSDDSTKEGTLGPALVNTTVGTTAATPLPYIPLGNNPTSITASILGATKYVYVVEQDTTTTNAVTANTGTLLAFSVSSTGALVPVAGNIPVPVAGSTLTGFKVGSKPSSIAEDPSSRYIYVTDQQTNQLFGFQVVAGGGVIPLNSSPFGTGQFPINVTIDPRGSFVYVANFADSTISVYSIANATGALSGGLTGSTKTGPTCITIEPARGLYLYTSNNTDNSITALQLEPHTGALQQVQGTPYTAQALPTCAVTIANGAHPTQLQTP